MLQPDNGLYIKTWTSDVNDTQFIDLLNILKNIAINDVDDVRPIIQAINEKINFNGDLINPYSKINIKKIIDIIHDNKNKEISQYKTEGKIKEIIKESDNLKVLAEKVEKVKTFLLFNVLYELNIAEDEDKTFNKAYKELDNIRDLLHNNIGDF